MTQLFGIPIDLLTRALLIITGIIIAIITLLVLSNTIFFKIGARNIPRRATQMILISFALMLSTTLLSSVLATGDVITAAIQSVAVYNLGNVDETITGGQGNLGFFSQSVYYNVADLQTRDPNIAAVSAALVEPDLLVADVTSRQVRSKVVALGIIQGSEQGFGGMHIDSGNGKKVLTIAALGPNDVYLNHTLAQLLNARAGDFIYLYSQRWPGQRYEFHVAAVTQNGGLVGETPYILTRINAFWDIENQFRVITEVFIANKGGGASALALSDPVAAQLQQVIPNDESIHQVKAQGVQTSLKAEDIFSRVFTLFCLFALAISLLLIFLIFVLLAAERRVEMGMARAIGVKRRHLVLMFLFEGTLYDFIASAIGLGFGLAVGAALIYFLGPTLARFNFPLTLTFQPHSLEIAYCLGVIFTFCAVAISSWLVSRMTIVEAIRDQPEPSQRRLALGDVCLRLLRLAKQTAKPPHTTRKTTGNEPAKATLVINRLRKLRQALLEQLPDALVELLRSLVMLGFLPLLAGYWLMQLGLEQAKITYFSLGFTLIVLGAGLLLRTLALLAVSFAARLNRRLYLPAMQRVVTRIFVTVTGLALLAYWALPFDALAGLGLPRFQGGIDIFFLAGSMMVLAGGWVLIANAELFISPLLALFARLPRLFILSRLASAYPLHRRFRTGLSVIMFSMVIFAMTVMAVITNAMQGTYANIATQTGGYDIQAISYFKPLPNLLTSLNKYGIDPSAFSQVGARTSTAVGVIQLNATTPRWSLYPAQVVSGGFLNGYGLSLVARAQGYSSDAAIWQALKTHPNDALIDSDALPYHPGNVVDAPVYDPSSALPADAGMPTYPPGFPPQATFALSGVYQGDSSFRAAPIWVSDIQHPAALKLTIIGVVDNSDSAHFGLYISQSAYDKANATHGEDQPLQLGAQIDTSSSDQLEQTTYYFKVAPGQDPRALSLKLGSAFLDYGLETTVLQDAIWEVRGPRIFLSNVLLGIVGMTLLLGVAALAITGTRAVVERRQQIGMLRALGCQRLLIQGAFLCESFLVGVVGSGAGVLLGLILSRNIFAANFFEQYQTGLIFSIPWQELSIIVGIALLASFLGALLPAWQAGRIAPAEALRYE